MTKLATIAELQKNTSPLVKYASKHTIILTNRGKGQSIMLPFFEGNEEAIKHYYEDYEMAQNREKLTQRYNKSLESGVSDLTI